MRAHYGVTGSPTADDFVPVVFCTLDEDVTVKGLDRALATFYGPPPSASRVAEDYRHLVLTCARRCGTTLFIVDDLHHLRDRRKNQTAVSGHLKRLTSELPATFLYVGVDCTVLLNEGYGADELHLAQNSSRAHVYSLSLYPLSTVEDRKAWVSLIATFASHLVLADPPTDLWRKHATYLHQRTSGQMNALQELLRRAANRAIRGGTERIDRRLLDSIKLANTAETRARAAGFRPSRGTRKRSHRSQKPAAADAMRLPLVCQPQPHEPQFSWIDRLAWENRCTTDGLLAHCGVFDLRRAEKQLGLRPPSVARLSAATTIAPEAIEELASRRLFENAGDPVDPADESNLLSNLARAHISFTSPRCCPECLLERDGAMHNHWLHRMSYCCEQHGLLLVTLADVRRELRLLRFRGFAPPTSRTPISGWNRITQEIGVDALDHEATATLKRILDGRSSSRDGHRLTPHETGRILWATALMLGRLMHPQDLLLDARRQQAMANLVARRRTTHRRAENARNHPDWLGAIVPSAWLLALGPDGADRDRLIHRLVRRLRDPEHARVTKPQTYYRRLPPWLRQEISSRFTATSSHRFKPVLRAQAGPARVVRPSQIPQMLWPTLFDDRFAMLLPGLRRDTARIFCSIALLRIDHCSSATEAELALGQRGQPALVTPHVLRQLHPWTHKGQFGRRLRALSDDLEGELLTDYANLRAAFEYEPACGKDLAEELARVIHRRGCLSVNDRALILGPTGRSVLAAWIWEHAIHCRFERSAAFNSGLRRAVARPIYERLLDPSRSELLDQLERAFDTPLHEPALARSHSNLEDDVEPALT